jgi:hypothetical protein
MSRSRVVTEFHAEQGQDASFLFDQGTPCKIVCSGSGSTRVIASESYPVIPEQYRFVPTDQIDDGTFTGDSSDSDEYMDGIGIARASVAMKICKTCQMPKPTDQYIQCGRSKKTNAPYYRSSCKICMKHSMR